MNESTLLVSHERQYKRLVPNRDFGYLWGYPWGYTELELIKFLSMCSKGPLKIWIKKNTSMNGSTLLVAHWRQYKIFVPNRDFGYLWGYPWGYKN